VKVFRRNPGPAGREERNEVHMTPEQAVQAFLAAFQLGDVETAMSVVDSAVHVDVYPLGLRAAGSADLHGLLSEIVAAFPDLRVTVLNVVSTDAVVTVELKVEGTQARDYLGAVNQEKHLDLDEAWQFTVAAGRISAVAVYWCQGQLYRRLAVKRVDQIAIV
jgi:predicted ester cyclase